MKKLLRYLLITIALPLAARAQDTTLVKNQANMMAKAIIDGDYKTMVDNVYPKLVQMAGGKDSMISVTITAIGRMKAQGLIIESAKVDAPDKFYKAGAEIHCLLPETVVIKLPNARIKSHSCILGISSDGGKTWFFLDLNNVNSEKIRQIVPNFNPAMQIPKATTERLD